MIKAVLDKKMITSEVVKNSLLVTVTILSYMEDIVATIKTDIREVKKSNAQQQKTRDQTQGGPGDK